MPHPKGKPLLLLFAFLMLFLSGSVSAQDFGSEKELKSKAEKLFRDDRFDEAMPLYSQLLSLYPSDPIFNYKFGVCMLYSTADKEKPLSYMAFALDNEDTPEEIYYHIGRAYHLNYRFDEAIKNYEIYKTKAGKKTLTRLDVDRQIEMCKNGKNLFRKVKDIRVVERKEWNESEYFRGFDLSPIQSKVITKPEELMTSFDKKKKETFTIVSRPGGKEIYFSSYGDDGKNGRDLYKVYLLDNQQWSKPENLGPFINTAFDEDFPYFTPDGKTLYFSSKGHNSMGGYDVFRCDYVPANGSWSTPVNLDFAINTPDDDVQFVADPASDMAWFASKRAVPKGKVSVYRIEQVPQIPVNSFVHGKVITGLPGKLPVTKIYITNLSNDVKESTLSPNQESAHYSAKLLNGGKYKYKVEVSGFAPLEQEVQIPELTEDRPLRQEIRMRKEAGQDFMEVLTFYADTGESEESKLARADWLKDKAKLDVSSMVQVPLASNVNANQRNAGNNRNTLKEAAFKAPEKNLSNDELLRIAQSDAREADMLADSLERISSSSLKFASDKLTEFNKLTESIASDISKAEQVPEGPLKQQTLQSIESRKVNAEMVGRKGQAAWLIYEDSYADAMQARKTADKEKAYAEEFDLAMKSGSKDAIDKIIAKANEEEPVAENTSDVPDIESQLSSLNSQIDRLSASRIKALKELEEIRMDEENTRAELNSTKDKDRKEQLSVELRELETQRKSVEPRLNEYNESLADYQAKHDRLEAVSEMQQELVEEIYSNDALVSASTVDVTTVKQQLAVFEAKQPASSSSSSSSLAYAQTKEEGTKPANNLNADAGKRLDNEAIAQKQQRINQLTALIAEETNAAKSDSYEKERAALLNELAANEVAKDKAKVEATLASLDHFQTHLNDVEKGGSLTETQQEFLDVQKEQLAATFEEAKKLRMQFSEEQDPEKQQELVDAFLNQATEYSKKANALSDRIPALATASQELRDVVSEEEQVEVSESVVAVQASNSLIPDVPLPELPTDDKVRNNSVIRQYEPGFSFSSDLSLTNEQLTEVRSTPEYAKVSVLLMQARESIVKGRNKAFVVQDYIDRGQAKLSESQQLTALASEEDNRGRRDLLNNEAIAADTEGKRLLSQADSIKKIVMVNMKQASVLKNDADKVLRTMKPVERDALISALTKYPAPQVVASTNTNTQAAKQAAPSDTGPAQNKEAGAQVDAAKQAALVNNQPATPTSQNTQGPITQANQQPDTNSQQRINSEENQQMVSNSSNSEQASNAGVENTIPDQQTNTPATGIRASEEYKAYSTMQNDLAKSKKEIDRMLRDADSSTVKAKQLLQEAENSAEFADATNDRKARKEAMQKAEDLTIQAAEQSVAADSLKELAEETRMYVATLELRSDSVLNAAGDAKASEIRLAYNNLDKQEPAQVTVASTPSNKQQNVPEQTNGAANTNAANQAVEASGQNAGTNQNIANVSNTQETVANTSQATSNSSLTNQQRETQQGAESQSGNQARTGENNQESNVATTNTNVPADPQSQTQKNASTSANSKQVRLDENGEEIKGGPPPPGVDLAAIRRSENYIAYAELKDQEDSISRDVDAKRTWAKIREAEANQYFEQSNALLEQAAGKKKKERKILVAEATGIENQGSALKAEADSVYALALEGESAARSKAAAANLILGRAGSEKAEGIVKTYSGEWREIALAVNETEQSATDEENIQQVEQVTNQIEAQVESNNQQATTTQASAEQTTSQQTLAQQTTEQRTIPQQAATQQTATQQTATQQTATQQTATQQTATQQTATQQTATRQTATQQTATQQTATQQTATQQTPAQQTTAQQKTFPEAQPRQGAVRRETVANNVVRTSFSTTVPVQGAIPMDPELPSGLVFKVQIGAFKKPLPAGSFGTISPVSGETRGGDWIRYTAGLFGAFSEASAARQQLNARGFRDAFIVAYCNGARISVTKAREFERNGTSCDGDATPTIAGVVNPRQGATRIGGTDQPEQNENNIVPANTNTTAATNPVQPTTVAPGETLPQENIATVKGLVYTIQVGVYSKPVTAGQLYNITPLYFEITANGKYRYTTGVYNNLNDANRAKDLAVGYGINDAFVSAYLNGKRIPMEEAAALVLAQGKTVFIERADMNRMPGQLRTGNPAVQNIPVAETPVAPRERVSAIGTPSESKLNRAELMFSVQLGAFKNQVPVEVMTRFLSIRDVTIGSYTDADGLTVFTGGTFGTPAEAEQLRDRLQGNGFSDAFVIALYQGKRISMEDAMKALR